LERRIDDSLFFVVESLQNAWLESMPSTNAQAEDGVKAIDDKHIPAMDKLNRSSERHRLNMPRGGDSPAGDKQRARRISVKKEYGDDRDTPASIRDCFGRGGPGRKRAASEFEQDQVAPAAAKKVKTEKEPDPVLELTFECDLGHPRGGHDGGQKDRHNNNRGKTEEAGRLRRRRAKRNKSVKCNVPGFGADPIGPAAGRCGKHRRPTGKCTVDGAVQPWGQKKVDHGDILRPAGGRCHQRRGPIGNCNVDGCLNSGYRKVNYRDFLGPPGVRCYKHGGRIGKCNVDGCTVWGLRKVGADNLGPAGARCFKHGGRLGKCNVDGRDTWGLKKVDHGDILGAGGIRCRKHTRGGWVL